MATPPVSVLMPVHNARRYLAEAIESIRAQGFSDFEFLVIDDGSTDGSGESLREYATRDGRIRLVSRPNAGIVASLNEGLALARGEFVARMDADDVAMPGRLEKQVRFLRENPDCVAVGSSVLFIDPDGCPLSESETLTDHESIDASNLAGSPRMVHPAVLFRREAVERVGGYRAEYQYAEDLDLFLRLAEVGRLANLPSVELHYRRHLDSIGYARSERQARAIEAAVAEAKRRRGVAPGPAVGAFPPGAGRPQHLRTWAWWALSSGHVATARKHALAALRRSPLSPASWKLMLCALRGF